MWRGRGGGTPSVPRARFALCPGDGVRSVRTWVLGKTIRDAVRHTCSVNNRRRVNCRRRPTPCTNTDLAPLRRRVNGTEYIYKSRAAVRARQRNTQFQSEAARYPPFSGYSGTVGLTHCHNATQCNRPVSVLPNSVCCVRAGTWAVRVSGRNSFNRITGTRNQLSQPESGLTV